MAKESESMISKLVEYRDSTLVFYIMENGRSRSCRCERRSLALPRGGIIVSAANEQPGIWRPHVINCSLDLRRVVNPKMVCPPRRTNLRKFRLVARRVYRNC